MPAVIKEWLLRGQALAAARAHIPRPDEMPARAYEQVRLLRAVTQQAAEPIEAPTGGHRAAVMLALLRDQVYWMLVAGAEGAPESDADLAALLRQAPRDDLLRAAGGEDNLASIERVLVGLSPMTSLDTTDEDVGRVQGFADALYETLATPRRRIARVLAQRWLRLGVVAAAVLVLALGVRSIARGPNLAKKARMTTSSMLPGCAGDPGCADLLFHTNQENNAWVEFDLGGPKPIHVIDIGNRPDCCQDRAVPLVAEVSLDRLHWKEVGRQDKEFSSWTVKFPRTVTRYVRLRVPRPTYFGFADVAIR